MISIYLTLTYFHYNHYEQKHYYYHYYALCMDKEGGSGEVWELHGLTSDR